MGLLNLNDWRDKGIRQDVQNDINNNASQNSAQPLSAADQQNKEKIDAAAADLGASIAKKNAEFIQQSKDRTAAALAGKATGGYVNTNTVAIPIPPVTPTGFINNLTFCPDDRNGLPGINNWAPTINGYLVKYCQYKISENKTGVRVDQMPALQFNFPILKQQGYALTTFNLTLDAYDQRSFDELATIHNSIMPIVYPNQPRAPIPPITVIKYPALTQRGLENFIPIEPSTSFLAYDQESRMHSANYTFLQYTGVAPKIQPISAVTTVPSPVGTGLPGSVAYPPQPGAK